MRRTLLALLATAIPCLAQDKPPVKPAYLHGHDVKVRNVGAKNFDATTPKVGVEFFHDTAGQAIVAITETGNIAVVPYVTASDKKQADWLAAFETMVRPAGESKFNVAKKFAAESFKDTASGKLLTVNNVKAVALADLAGKPELDKDPTWHHAMEPKVRGVGEADFSNAKKIGLEVYKDGPTGGLLYITETGYFCYAPPAATPVVPDAIKAPKGLHGWTLQSRKADEGNFTKDTKVWNVEVMLDPNSGSTLYICETGSIAAVTVAEPKKGQGVAWSHSFVLKPRKAGDKDFDKAAKYGIEVFEDKNTGALIYISETGSIAVKK